VRRNLSLQSPTIQRSRFQSVQREIKRGGAAQQRVRKSCCKANMEIQSPSSPATSKGVWKSSCKANMEIQSPSSVQTSTSCKAIWVAVQKRAQVISDIPDHSIIDPGKVRTRHQTRLDAMMQGRCYAETTKCSI
jgi:hypothetical protein